MIDLIIGAFLISGAAFMLLAALGILRLPDLPTRMHSSTKAGALGAMLIMGGVVLGFAQWLALARGVAIVLFIMMTTPIAAHAIGRAGYLIGVPLWDGTIKDELRENYDSRTHSLRSDAADDDEPRV
ncbi:monovalent cation/H(+) antiporter subunit G [Salicola sp. Rm-C-2C1-2]|uniref:monovalent cation/H(+) antiporter subunit G n=1 Tax=Salicola sp. Rm-C-2C1-2 TaxID=3141321 RepID=UPI0032E48D79